MELLRESGVFDERRSSFAAARPSSPAGERAAPRPRVAPGGGPAEFTYLKVVVTGRKFGKTLQTTFELLDKTHRATGTTSMARTTAFPCAVIARMLARGEYRDPGVRPLEMVAANRDAAARFELGLTARGIRWTKESHEVEAAG